MTISEMYLPEWDKEMESTRKLLAVLPEKLTEYKPHAKSMPLDRLAGHVAQLPGWAKTAMDTEVLDMDPKTFVPFAPKTRTELLAVFEKNAKEGRAAIAGGSDEAMAKTWTFKMNGQTIFAYPRSFVIRASVINHIIHHRAQLGVYLRLLEIAIPGMYGPSADEMGTFGAAK